MAANRSDPLPWGIADPALVAQLHPGEDAASWLGDVHEGLLSRDAPGRAQRGAFYTPAAWVEEALDPAMDAISREGARPRILDPACGAGAFLLHALDRLTLQHGDAAEAVRQLKGVDRDPWAARVCRVALAIRAGVALDVPDVVHGDALLGPSHSGLGKARAPDGTPTIDWTQEAPFHLVIGNPPFLGGKRQLTVLGKAHAHALRSRRGLTGNTDLAAHFLHLAAEVLAPDGEVVFWLTDTVAQGETRREGLGRLVPDRWTLTRAIRSRPWPGDASVYVAFIHAVNGRVQGPLWLDGRPVEHISSRLRSDRLEEVPPPRPEVHPAAFVGCDLKGPGFLFGDEAGHSWHTLARLRAHDPAVDDVIRPYVTGRTLTRSLDGEPSRVVADLSAFELEEAQAAHPGLMRLLEAHLKPDRARRSPVVARAPWWRFFRTRPALRQALRGHSRCLAAGLITQHLLWTWQPADRVFNHKVVVVATEDDAIFGALQCRLHDIWARALSSTFGGGLNYAPSRCYANYPLPPRTEAVARAARQLEQARRDAISALQIGLGPLQTRLVRGDRHPAIEALRGAQAALDQAVLMAWGWSDLDLEHTDAVIDRLLQAPDHGQPTARERGHTR